MRELPHEERLDRLEKVVQFLAEDQLSLQKLIGQLATETRLGFDRVAKQAEDNERRFKQTEDRFREVEKRFRETDQRFRDTDERINKLVSAMGEFIRRQDNAN